MDPLTEPLQWWAYGHYAEVLRQLERRRKPGDKPVTPLFCRRLIKGAHPRPVPGDRRSALGPARA